MPQAASSNGGIRAAKEARSPRAVAAKPDSRGGTDRRFNSGHRDNSGRRVSSNSRGRSLNQGGLDIAQLISPRLIVLAAIVIALILALTFAIKSCSSSDDDGAVGGAAQGATAGAASGEGSGEGAAAQEEPTIDQAALASIMGDDLASQMVELAASDPDLYWIASHPEAVGVDGAKAQRKLLKLATVEPAAISFVRNYPDSYPDETADACDSLGEGVDVPLS